MLFPLHHIGFLVKDVSLAASDFVSRLGYVVDSEVIEDSVQTACVQFLRQPGANNWLELIMPNGPHSKLLGALQKGGGLHHLCYEVEDIARACEHMRSRSMLMIARPVPAVAFPGRRIAWFMDRSNFLLELLEAGEGPLSLTQGAARS
ncbi:MAG: VOC family protein [Candidatus Competibacter sp.]|nr:VOC family protein [Candidatus Competibacter sp.]